MAEMPILFSSPMVQAILRGEKTQTRRVIKGDPLWFDGELVRWIDDENLSPVKHPSQAGDLLWVRERHTFVADHFGIRAGIAYADGLVTWLDDASLLDGKTVYNVTNPDKWKWRPSIFMPRWASRITLRVTDVRAERLQTITFDDVEAEGIGTIEGITPDYWVKPWADLWDSINAKRGYGWESNPWVWVYTFEKVE